MEDEDVSNDLRLVRSLLSRSPESTADGASLAGIVRALDRHDASSEGDAYRTWRRLLPWLEARRAVESGDEPGAVAGRLREAGAVRMLAARTVVRELQSRGVAPDDQEAIVLALERLVDREFALRSCSDAADDELFAELMADAGLLAAAIDLCAVDDGEFARRLRRAVPPLGREEADWPARSRSLGILADLESGRADVLAGADDLGDRVRRFETGLVDNLRHQGFGDVVRAALAFGSRRRCSVEEIRVPLRSETFCGSPARVRLARELAAVRGRVLRCIRGRLPLSGLHRWVEYLTVGSRRLAEELGVTHAEAAGYAHYCLHLVDVCDLAADGRLAAETRAGILSVEERLKELALEGEAGAEARDALERHERRLWRPRGPRAYLADRIARLIGVRRGPVGPGGGAELEGEGGEQPDGVMAAHEVWRAVERRHGRGVVDAMGRFALNCRVTGADWWRRLDAERAAALFAGGLVAARDRPGVDVTAEFRLDAGAPGRALSSDDEAGGDLVDRFLDRHRAGDLLEASGEELLREPAVSVRVEAAGDGGAPVVRYAVELDEELEALSTLLSAAPEDDAALRTAVRKRLGEKIEDRAGFEVPGGGRREEDRDDGPAEAGESGLAG